MEATGEDLSLLHKINPPRLEDAGLEDCALPPSSIHAAFLKAATAVGSRAAAIITGDNDGACVDDPSKSPPSDTLIGIEPETRPPGPCVAGKGGAWSADGESASDVVVVGGGERKYEKKDDDVVVVGGESEGGGCVDGLSGLEIKDNNKDQEKNDDNDKKPTLVEGYFMNP